MLFSSLLQYVSRNPARNRQGRLHRLNKAQPCAKPRAKYVPLLEALEDRTVPSYVFHTLDDPNGVNFTLPFGINNRGQIVGGYFDASDNLHGFILNHGHYTTIDDPNGVIGTNPSGINEDGQIVGGYFDTNFFNSHGFILNHGHYTTIDDPNGVNGTFASGINAEGQIVGQYFDARGNTHGFILNHGHYTTIDDPNGVLGSFAQGINDRGQIVGGYIDASDNLHGFLATPAEDNESFAAILQSSPVDGMVGADSGANAAFSTAALTNAPLHSVPFSIASSDSGVYNGPVSGHLNIGGTATTTVVSSTSSDQALGGWPDFASRRVANSHEVHQSAMVSMGQNLSWVGHSVTVAEMGTF